MALCDQGYLCEVCGEDVACLTDSDLYLRYVIGEIDPEVLHTTPERHIRCNPTLAQFIDHADFEPVVVESAFDRRELDAAFVDQRTELVTRGFARLLELEKRGGDSDVTGYPLPEVIAKWSEKV
ncbi:MAG: hypothetical protein ACO1RT_13950 [Planctomycetaceae bacterium]